MAVPLSDAELAGRYRLEAKIAFGGMGEVWRGEDTVLGRPVAVKLMRREFAGDPETLARFRAEARHSAALSHPGIAHVYDYGENGPGGSPFIVMELVNGPSLTQLLTRGPLAPAHVMDIVAQAATALAAAHSTGLVHRDIKPGNILVAPGNVVKITDFGIAYAAGSAPLTRTGSVIGTPAYLAPERISGSPGSPASDLYALGMVAYECLAGTLPFTGTAVEITQAYARRRLPPLPPSVPGPVAALVAQLTSRDPAARPASAAEVAARSGQLRDALAHRTQPAGPLPAANPALATKQITAPPVELHSSAAEPAAWPVAPAGPLAAPEPPTLLDVNATVMDMLPGAAQRAGSGKPRRRHPVLLVAAVVAVLAILGGLLIARQLEASASQHRATGPRATPAVPLVSTVNVDAPALIGLPVRQAAQQLRQLGLTVQMVQVPTANQQPGTVLDVSPSGQVPQGSTVALDTAVSPKHHHSGDGGQGNGDSG
jgi:eukaryotic-like serine/threonine-protein kinase